MRPRIGKCTKYSSCKLAYRNERITVFTKDFVCPECGSPLETIRRSPRSYDTWFLTFAVLAVLAMAVAAVLWARQSFLSSARPPLPVATPTPPPPTPQPTVIPVPTPFPTPVYIPPTPPPTPLPTPTPTPSLALDLTADQLQRIKTEVLKRIQLMPDLSDKQKNFLIAALGQAKGVKLLATLSFATGQNNVSPSDLQTVRDALAQPVIQQAIENPTLVFVVLGYASQGGSTSLNVKLSQQRAETVMTTLQQQLGLKNVIYPVPMGPSELLGDGSKVANQAAEVWIVVP